MPRKPSSVFLIAEDPASTMQQAGMPATSLKAWRLPLPDGQDVDDVVLAHYLSQPVGTTLYVVEDTKVDGFTVVPTLQPVEDPRLDPENGPDSPG